LNGPISEWSDDQALGTSEKLVLILEVDVCDRYHALVRLLDVIEASLFLPLEVRRRLYVLGALQQTIQLKYIISIHHFVDFVDCRNLCGAPDPTVRTEIRLWFPGLFQDKITSFSRLFKAFGHPYVNKTLQNWLLNADISYTMYFSILNMERDSNY